jgi:hypothetical protein
METSMRKLLLLGAATLLATTLAAGAQVVGHSTTIILRGATHGDLFTFTKEGDDFFAQTHRHGGPQMGEFSFGVGMTASTPYIYNGIMVTDFGKNGTYQACYDFEYPFRTGGHWLAYRTYDGQHVQYLGRGTYIVLGQNGVGN